jgi:hypothetical protein
MATKHCHGFTRSETNVSVPDAIFHRLTGNRERFASEALSPADFRDTQSPEFGDRTIREISSWSD